MDDSGFNLGEDRRHGHVFPIPTGPVSDQPTLVKSAVHSLNKLAGIKVNNACQLAHRPLTSVQTVALENVKAAVMEAGECPDGMTGVSCVGEMMSSSTLYGEPSTLVPFDVDKLKILKSSVTPKLLSSVMPPHILPLLKHAEKNIELSAAHVERRRQEDPKGCPRVPYWDPTLKTNRQKRCGLLAGLWKIGVVSFRLDIKASIGLFFVKKKDPAYIRMVVDGRIPNFCHRPPPVTRLGSGANFTDIDLTDEMLTTKLGSLSEPAGFGIEMDVSDAFYQFKTPEVAKWFGVNMPMKVCEWAAFGVSIKKVYDEDQHCWHTVSPDTLIYPVIEAMSMGWSWALFFANETISYLARGESPRAAPEFRERMVAPQLWSSDALVSTYVDNVSIIGASRSAVLRKADEVTKVFEELQIPVVWSQSEPVKQLETVGIILDFDRKVVRNKHSRIWRVYLAGREIARRSRVRGEVVEAWLGHTTFLMRLAPFLLSIFTSIYRFVQISRGKRYVLWPSVRAEILQACSLIWFARAHLGGKYIHDVDMGDSSGFGYALMTATWSPEEIHLASQFRERWRYVPFPDDLKDAIEKQDFQGMFERRDDERTRAFIRAGVGPNTEYGQWIQDALVEGSWIRTSSLATQLRAKKRKRIDVEIPTLVPPLGSKQVAPDRYRLL